MTDEKKKDKKDRKDAKKIDDEQLKDVAGGTVGVSRQVTGVAEAGLTGGTNHRRERDTKAD
ncbi:MAG: hypothetical protein AAEJ04_05380 [Planctomycetota bacterium]